MKEKSKASPIKIASGRDTKPTRMMAHSAPNPSTDVPKAPSSRPKVPQRDPPVMMLPPSPPVFSPAQGIAQPPRFVSDWTSASVFSSSCPNTTYDIGAQKKKEKEWSLTPLDEMDEPEEVVQPKYDDLSKLSQSPTIFSLLQHSLPTNAGIPFKPAEKAFVPSSRGSDTVSINIAPRAEAKRTNDLNDTEEIMFPMSMDGDADSELAAEAEQYLTFH